MYYKRSTGTIIVQKSEYVLHWVQWTHHSEGKTHCEECLKLDGCWFQEGKAPPCPHHPFCHCTLDPIPYTIVVSNASAHSAYSKFDPYLFNTTDLQTHNKEKLFQEWGYTVEDARWLQTEMECQARERYVSGEYELGALDSYGQRMNIRIIIPRKDGNGYVSFVTGWMAESNGKLRLITPYGGK